MADNDLDLNFDPSSFIAALNRINKARAEMEAGVTGAADRMAKAWDRMGGSLTTVTDRARQAQKRYVESIEMTAVAYGRSGAEKLIAQRDQIIKRLGTEEAYVKRVTEAYAKMLKVEEERAKNSSSGQGSGMLALRGVRDLFEGRTAYGEVQLGKSIAGLSGIAAIAGGAAAGLLAIGAAAATSVVSLGEFGVQMKDIELRTGLTAKEVAQFSFAAKSVGQEVDITERIMRGLSQATEDMGSGGAKARKVMADLGVSIYDVNGNIRPTADILLQISRAFEKLPAGTKLSRDAIDLFKRAGVEAIPFLKELAQNVDYFDKKGLPAPNQGEIDTWSGYNKQLAELSVNWANFRRELLSPLGTTGAAVLNWLLSPGSGGGGGRFVSNALPSSTPPSRGTGILNSALGFVSPGGGAGERQNAEALKSFLSGRGGLEAAQEKEAGLKRDYEEARQRALAMSQSAGISTQVLNEQKQKVLETNKAYERQKEVVQQIQKAETDRKAVLEDLRKGAVEAGDKAAHPFGMLPAEKELLDFSRKSGVSQADIARRRTQLQPQLEEEVRDILRRAGLEVSGGEVGRSGHQLSLAKGVGVTPTGDISAQSESAGNAAIRLLIEQNKEANKKDEEFVRLTELKLTNDRKFGEKAAESSVRLQSTLAPNTVENRLAAEEKITQIKQKAAVDEYNAAAAKAAKDIDSVLALEELRMKANEEIAAAQDQLDQARATEIRKQMDSIKSEAESLFSTLFNNPSKFGSQLGTTLKAAALRPVIEGLSETTSRVLQPVIFGAGGTGGIAGAMRGVFGGGRAPMINGVPAVHVVNLPGSGGGTTVYGSGGGFGGYSGGGGTGAYSSGGGAGGGLPFGFGSGSPGGTGGFAGPVGGINLGGGGTAGVGGAGGGGLNLGGLGGMLRGGLSSLKSAAGFGNIFKDANGDSWAQVGTHAIPLDSFKGKLQAFGSSALAKGGALAGGTILAQRGLLGASRGTAGGVFEGTLGGAGIGFAYGGPLGAAIGAVAGLGIGLGEVIAGVESPENEAKRLAKSIYGIKIDTSTAKQIAGIAQQSYAGHISVAIRAPEVRNMLMLYSQSTGQGNLLSSTVPRSGSLQESGGALSQLAGFANGTPYVYQSSLPVAGGFGANIWPGQGGATNGPTYLSLSIAGKGAGDFMAGNVVTPEFVQSQWGSAQSMSNGRVQNAALFSQPGLITS